jgi:hypothetical protein
LVEFVLPYGQLHERVEEGEVDLDLRLRHFI